MPTLNSAESLDEVTMHGLMNAFCDELEKLGMRKVARALTRTNKHHTNAVPLERGDLDKFKARYADAGCGPGDGCSLGRDVDGYYCFTHRARSKSYPSPSQIPLDRIRFIGSTA